MTTPPSGPATRVQPNAFGCITVPFLLIALIPLGWGARSQWENGALARQGHVVAGRVLETRYVPSNTSASRAPRGGRQSGESAVVAFTTRDGQARQMTGSVNRYPVPWRVGDQVEVVYDPADPQRVDLRSELVGWKLWLAIWCVVAAVPAAIAMAPVLLFLRQGRAGE